MLDELIEHYEEMAVRWRSKDIAIAQSFEIFASELNDLKEFEGRQAYATEEAEEANIRAKFEAITDEMTDLFMQKNTDYGDSVFETMDEFGMTANVIRLNDKIKRLKTLAGQEAKVKDESMRDTLLDVANYAVTGLMWLDKQEETR